MKIVLFCLLLVARLISEQAADPTKFETKSPATVVEQLWTMAVRGDLLTDDGRRRTSGFFTEPDSSMQDGMIRVFSNYFGVNRASIEGDSATVDMEFTDQGQIDSKMRYIEPKRTQAYKTSFEYKLSLVPGRIVHYGPDGKTIQSQKVAPEYKSWVIVGHLEKPFTTVNTAIRYVLEQKEKSADPQVKRNADQTLAKLLQLH